MKKIITTWKAAAVLTAIICLFSISVYGQTGSTDECLNLEEFLRKEFATTTKPVKENPGERIYGIQQKDAMTRALNVCAKLKARQVPADGEDIIYELPGQLGKVTIHELTGSDRFLRLTFDTKCKVTFNDIHFVSLKYYNDYGTK